MWSLPFSQVGKNGLIKHPASPTASPKMSIVIIDCLSTERASAGRPAPMRWATCTENPVVAALHTPAKSHIVVDTSPIEAESSAPSRPTIEASIYCMSIDVNWASIAGIESRAVSRNSCFNVMALPSRIIASNASFPSVAMRFCSFFCDYLIVIVYGLAKVKKSPALCKRDFDKLLVFSFRITWHG